MTENSVPKVVFNFSRSEMPEDKFVKKKNI